MRSEILTESDLNLLQICNLILDFTDFLLDFDEVQVLMLVSILDIEAWVDLFDDRLHQFEEHLVGLFVACVHTDPVVVLDTSLNAHLDGAALRRLLALQIGPHGA